MKSILTFFINRSFIVNIISALIIFSGVILGSMIKRDIIPPFEWKSVNVEISLPGASATEVEKFLAYPIENALQGLPHASEITTQSSNGSLSATVFFRADHKGMNESVEMIRSRINSIAWQLPEQSRNINVTQNKVDSVFLMGIALENFEETNSTHRQIAKRIADKITAIPGIIQTNVQMNDQNLYVKLKPNKIIENEVSISEVRNRIKESLSYSPIGKVDFDDKSVSVEVNRPAESVESFKKLAIRGNRNGNILYLEKLADISLDVDEIKERHRFNGNAAINLYTRKDVVSDSILLKTEILKVINETNKTLPKGLKATVFIDHPKFIETQLGTLKYNGIFGLILVLVLLTLFFNWKVSLATSFGIPIAYCGTLVALYALNISIDMISVVGMILVLGILVDDAIIITERYIENLESGLEPKEAAIEASRDLLIPVTGTVLTTVLAFAPMILIASEIANIFYAIPIVIIVSLIMSWFESFFILPNHLKHFIKTAPKSAEESGFYLKCKKKYSAALFIILKYRYPVFVFLVTFFAFSGWIAKNKIQQNFNFNPSSESIALKVILKENKSLAFTEKTIKPIEDFLLTLPKNKFKATHSSIGQMWDQGRNWTGYRYAKLFLHIDDSVARPEKLKTEYTKIIKDKIKELMSDDIESIKVGHEKNDQDEMKKDMITIEVIGNEDVDYLDLKETITKSITKNKFTITPVKEINEFEEKWIFTPDTKQLAQHRMNLGSLSSQLRSFFVPHELMQIRLNGETKWIYTQVAKDKAIEKSQLNKMTVLNNLDLSVPMETLGSWSKKNQLATVNHKDGKRMFSFDLAYVPSDTMNITLAKEQGQKVAEILIKKFPTYSIELKDADRAEASSRAWALKVALLCITLVLFTLAIILGSLSLPLIVGLPIPFGLMGIVWALYLHNMPMGIMSLIGLIGTVGVSVNDSLIMVDQIMKKSLKNGTLNREIIVEGASSRLRAIILTTVTTLGGVFPMAYGIGGESGYTAPLAFSIGWGLFFSTFLTLFALPAFMEIRLDMISGLKGSYFYLIKFISKNKNDIFKKDSKKIFSEKNEAPNLKPKLNDKSILLKEDLNLKNSEESKDLST